MGKNNAFTKNAQAVQGDPVAEAQAAAAAAAAAESSAEDNKEPSVLEGLVQQTATQAASETQAPEKEVEKASSTVVEETTAEKQAPVTQPVVVAKRSSEVSGVRRPTGASPREATPAVEDRGASPVSTQFGALIGKERKEGTATAQYLIVFLDNYINVMRPRKVTSADDVLRMQEGLYDVLTTVIEKAPSNEFNRLWRIAIAYVREYKEGCFSPMYSNRGARDWKRDPQQFSTLAGLINLLYASANDLSTVSKEVNVSLVAGRGFSEEGRGRLINFYTK